MCMPQNAYGGNRATDRSQFFLRLGLPCLAAAVLYAPGYVAHDFLTPPTVFLKHAGITDVHPQIQALHRSPAPGFEGGS